MLELAEICMVETESRQAAVRTVMLEICRHLHLGVKDVVMG